MKATTIRAAGLGLVILTLVALVIWARRPVGEIPPVDALRSDASSSESAPTLTAPEPTLHGRGEGLTSGEGWEVLVTVLEGQERTPVADAEVRVALYTEGQRDQEVERRTRTDGEGLVRIDLTDTGLSPESLLVHVDTRRNPRDGYAHEASPVEGEERLLAVTIVLEAGVAARGVVAPPPGVPLSNVRLWEDDEIADRVRLGPGGSFGWEGLRPGAVIPVKAAACYEGTRHTGHGCVVAGRDDFALTWTEARPGDRVLTRVRLQDAAGCPVTAKLHVDADSELFAGCAQDWRGEGEVLIDFVLHPGAVLHLAGEPLAPAGLGHVHLRSIPVRTASIDLVFAKERLLHGRIRRDGGPVADLQVGLSMLLRTRQGLQHPGCVAQTTTDARGRFTVGGLGPHEYALFVLAPNNDVLAEITVGPDESDLSIVIEPATDVTLRVMDAKGRAVPGAHVELSLPPLGVTLDAEEVPYCKGSVDFRSVGRAWSGEGGRAVLRSIDASRPYRLVVAPPRGRDDLLRVEIQGWEPKDEVVQLERGWFIQGRVEDSEGNSAADQWVSAECPDLPNNGARVCRMLNGSRQHRQPSVRTDAAGAFTLGPVPEGRWHLYAFYAKDSVVEAETGASDVVIRLPAEDTREYVDVRVRVVDLRPGDRGTFALLDHRCVRLDSEGRAKFIYMQEGSRSELWIAPLSDGRYVWEKDVEATTEEIVVHPKRGASIRGRVRVPDDVVLDSLSLWCPGGRISFNDFNAGCFAWTADSETGTFEVTGVPPGTWYIAVSGAQGARRYEGEVDASPGDEVIVDLE